MNGSHHEATSADLLGLILDQQRQIDALKIRRRGLGQMRVPLTVMATAAMVIVVSGAVYAAGPVTSNVVNGCYNTKTLALSVAKSGKCATGTALLTWDQYTHIAATSPLAVAPGSKGSAPSVRLTGVVPVANGGTGSATKNFVDLTTGQTIGGAKTFSNPIHGSVTGNAGGFTGSLSGDVTGTQRSTTVTGIQGTSVSSSAPSADQVLSFNGTKWTPTNVYNPLQVAELRWYAANQTGVSVTVGNAPVGGAFDGRNMWIANDGSGTVSEIDVVTHSVFNTVNVGTNPDDVAFDGSHIWVTNFGSGTVSEIADTATPRVINTVNVGAPNVGAPIGVAFDGSHIWVTNSGSGTVSEIDVASHSVINTVNVGTNPFAIAFDGSHIWVTNDGSGTVSEIADTATPAVINTVNVGTNPRSVVFDGSHIWVANYGGGTGGGTVSEIADTATPGVINTVNVGTGPRGVAFDGSHIWVTNFGSGTVSIL